MGVVNLWRKGSVFGTLGRKISRVQLLRGGERKAQQEGRGWAGVSGGAEMGQEKLEGVGGRCLSAVEVSIVRASMIEEWKRWRRRESGHRNRQHPPPVFCLR